MPKSKQPKSPRSKSKDTERTDEVRLEGAAVSENKDLKKISLHVNSFGQIVRDIQTDEINAFLDDHVPDKKFDEA